MVANKLQVLILGGGYAGLMAAARLARKPGIAVTLVDRKPFFQQRIRWHQVMAGDAIKAGDYRQWLAKAGIDFIQSEVVSLDLERRQAGLSNGFVCQFDQLVYALGSQVSPQRISGAAEHGWMLTSQAQAEQIQSTWRSLSERRAKVALVGGGLTQLESAAELAERYPGLQVQLITHGDPFAPFHPKGGEHLAATLEGLGVQVTAHTEVVHIHRQALTLDDGTDRPFDACLVAPGFDVPDLARQAGLAVNDRGQIQVNHRLTSISHPFVWVAGDSAAFEHYHSQQLRMGCVAAMPMGAQVGENLIAQARGKAPTPFSFGFVFRCISLGRRNGLIQFTDYWDRPTPKIVTGQGAVRIKEWICKMTYYVPKWELSTGLRLYRWPNPTQAQVDAIGQVTGQTQ